MNIGQTILHYRVEELIGEGGMGTVYRGRDLNLDRSVAMKVIYRHLLKDPTTLDRFRNEAIILAQLSHPNVAGLYNFQPHDGVWVMVMEYVDGQTFEQLLKQNGPLSVEKTLGLMRQVLAGLQHAHNLHVLHRDLKPANLMLTRDGRVKLMDFGIARKAGAERLTRANHLIGTLDYMAPELIAGKEPSVQSELYSLGIVLYELLTGHLPFTATTEPALISAIMRQKPTPPRTFCADLPTSVCDLLTDLLHKKPDHRPADVATLDARIASILATLQAANAAKEAKKTTPATRTTAAPHKQWLAGPARLLRSLGTFEGLMLAGSLLVVGAVLTTIWLFRQPDPGPKPPPHFPQEINSDKPADDTPQSQTTSSTIEPVAFNTIPGGNAKKPVIRPITPTPVDADPSPKRSDPPVTDRKRPTPGDDNRRTRDAEPVRTNPADPPTTDEETAHPPVSTPASVRTVALRGREVLLELLEDVSPQGSVLGSTVRLRVVRPITVDGLTVIEVGAPATATVTDRKWSEGGRTFLEITLQQVKATNGSWIQIKYPPISESGSSTNPVEFPRGTRIEARLRDSSLTLAI
ncbi:serine/threonine protein kinase [uncultured Fibrella sp.]|uniref:serine/threonine protein kinase n=1 Tax=uncultured Fibrella sp. TaxID=1284596 RepID=UPI0035CB574B